MAPHNPYYNLHMRKVLQTPTKQVQIGRASSISSPGLPSLNPINSALASQNQYMMMRTLQTSTDQILQQQKNTLKQMKSNTLDKMIKEDYQPAQYSKAVIYRNERSYMKKTDNNYKQFDLFCDTDELRYFGLGPYFYVQFFRRIVWLFFVLTLLNILNIYINYQGTGLSNYSLSFSSYLIMTTLGNYSGSVLTKGYDGYIIALVPAACYMALLLFYFIWKYHYLRTIGAQEEDNKDVKPEKFCVQVVGLPEIYIDEDELVRFFSSFGPVYQVSMARKFDDKLSYFQEMDQLQESIKEQQLQLVLGGDDSNRKSLAQKTAQLQKLRQTIQQIQIRPSTVSAFVHFQFQKSKIECLSYFNDHHLYKKCSHDCARCFCCCCVTAPDHRVTFMGNPLMIANQIPPTPQDINWKSFQIGCCNQFLRGLVAFLVILIFLALSCTIIGLCSIYISSRSNDCSGFVASAYTPLTAQLTGSSTIMRCYCNANLVASFTDSAIKNACGSYLTDIYVEQTIQYVVLITSAVTNMLFGLISNRLVNFVRPASRSAALMIKTTIMTLFLMINSVLIPVLIYSNIFGFTPSSYVSFLTIISTDIQSFFSVSTLSFYPNFTAIWYRNVSPLFTNYIIFNIATVWGSYLFFKCCCSRSDSLRDKEHRILQKTMNKKITEYRLDVENQAANLYLIIIMASLFWSGIPAIVPLAFFNILSRYIINRSLLQNHSKRIEGLGEQFNSFTLILLPIILIFFPLIGEWMVVANSSIYPYGIPYNFTFGFLTGHFYQLDLEAYLPFYLIVSAVVVAEIVIYNSIIKFCACICGCCVEKKQVQYHPRPFNEYTKSLNLLCSYNIRNNDKMRNTIINLEKYLIQHNIK